MSIPVKPKKSRKEPQPSYRAIQLVILAELTKQNTLLEVLAKQGDITVAARSTACADFCSVVRPATGAAASGLPG